MKSNDPSLKNSDDSMIQKLRETTSKQLRKINQMKTEIQNSSVPAIEMRQIFN